jgi:pimeloyl-ACP methyl ester carboxylesterase
VSKESLSPLVLRNLAIVAISEGTLVTSYLLKDADMRARLTAVSQLAGIGLFSVREHMQSLDNDKKIFFGGCPDIDYRGNVFFFDRLLSMPTQVRAFCYPEMTHSWWKSLRGVNPRESLNLIKQVPHLFINGEQDPAFVKESLLAVREISPQFTVALIPRHGHAFEDLDNPGKNIFWQVLLRSLIFLTSFDENSFGFNSFESDGVIQRLRQE